MPGIVFVAAPAFDDKTDISEGYTGSYHWRDGFIYPRDSTYHRLERTTGPTRPGKNLYALVPARPDGKLTRLTHLTTGAVFKPEPYFDGKKVLFSMRRDGEDWFHLYEINVDGSNLRQLTDGPFNDFGGVYLPDGRIVFCSDRTGYLEEYHEERAETLFIMNGDGRGLEQITFLPGVYSEPWVLRDGRIMFSFWDAFHLNVPPLEKHETYLATVNPDGTEERQLFGAGQYRFFNRQRHGGIGLSQARELADRRIIVQSEMGPSLLDLRAGLTIREALAPIFPGTTSIQNGGTGHNVHLSPLGTRSTSYPLPDGCFLFSRTAPGARDSAIYLADPKTRREELVFDIPNYAEFDAVPVLMERPRPTLASPAGKGVGGEGKQKKAEVAGPTARFLVVAGRVADNPERAKAMQKARYFRVIETEYTGVTASSHTNLETRILGVVPIFPDGSAYFEAPADTPLFLDPLDAAGNRVLMNWNYPNTSAKTGLPYPATQMGYMSARPGETRACFGCHASQKDAALNVTSMALKYGPVKITRESTDLQYRRNDPDAHRRQARVGEVGKYAGWLLSKDPVLRARGCEALMHIEDLTIKELVHIKAKNLEDSGYWFWYKDLATPFVVELLKDNSVAVRRAASLALTKLARAEHAKDLREALQDTDWQVRFSATAALETLGQTVPSQNEFPTPKSRSNPFEQLGRQEFTQAARKQLLDELAKPLPEIAALRAAGKIWDEATIKFLAPWLKNHEYEYHAAEAAVALGRIGTKEAVDALWEAVRSEIPIKKVHNSRYFQHGPRPEEYALLKGLLLTENTDHYKRPTPTGVEIDRKDLFLLIAILPNTFMEKPRIEDRMKAESQRVFLPRRLLGPFRQPIVANLIDALRGKQQKEDPLYEQILKGINLERPFSEHGRPFPVVGQIGPEEALWLLTCLLEPAEDLKKVIGRQQLEELVVPLLFSQNPRERIDAAVLLGITGFGPKTAEVLLRESLRHYPFSELTSIGQGQPGTPLRDKAYFVYTLARHIEDVKRLEPLADPKKMFRDIRYGLARGLAERGKPDGIPILLEMAAGDPITLIRQQARYALADIQDACRLAGRPVPEVKLLPPRPLESLYPPRGLKWAKTAFADFNPNVTGPPRDGPAVVQFIDKALSPANFRNLNFAQVSGARYMMTAQVEETRLAFAVLAKQPAEVALPKLLAALETPYPYVHYLAAASLAQRGDKAAIPTLVRKLDQYLKVPDPVGFWWCCEALGQMQVKEAIPVLQRHATASNPPGTFGPPGMAAGYVAARTLARILADANDKTVAEMLRADNIWLRAGTLRGLAEAHVAGVEVLLRQALTDEAALVREEARVQLHRLAPGTRSGRK